MNSKAREALKKANRTLGRWREDLPVSAWEEVDTTILEIQSALAAPPRNCDVGTAEEQEERYIKLKREYVDRLLRCPAEGSSFFPDSLYWAQMPYESEVKNVANS